MASRSWYTGAPGPDRRISDQALRDAAAGVAWLASVPAERRLDALTVVAKVWIERPDVLDEVTRG